MLHIYIYDISHLRVKKRIISQHHRRYRKAFDTSQNDGAPSNYRMEDKTNECCIQTNAINFFSPYITRKALTNKETAIFQSDPTTSPHSFTLVHELLEAICKQFLSVPCEATFGPRPRPLRCLQVRVQGTRLQAVTARMSGEKELQISVLEPFQNSLLTYYRYNGEYLFFSIPLLLVLLHIFWVL